MTGDADAKNDDKAETGHVLAVEIAGYSKLPGDDQTRVTAELTAIVQGSTRFRVAQASDKLISLPTADGVVLIFFGDAEAAMECAMEISAALKKNPKIRLRMGLHSGPVSRIADINEAHAATGAGIEMAKLVMDCGDEGHILLSRRLAYDLAPLSRWSDHLYELGDCEVTNEQKISLVNFYNGQTGNQNTPTKVLRTIDESRARQQRAIRNGWLRLAAGLILLLLIASGIFYGIHRRFSKIGPPSSPVASPEKSIAVLPFVDLSPARNQEYLSDGMSEEILGALSKTEGLRVVARASSFLFKGKNLEVTEIGRALNTSTILEGTLKRDGNRVRIFARLINARDGYELWSNTYEREMQGLVELEDEISHKVVEALKVRMAMTPIRPPLNIEAYELYLNGLFFSNRSNEPEMLKSLSFFERALDKDPRMPRAWAGIAEDWIWLAGNAGVAPREAYPQVERGARKALALDDSDAKAHTCLGEVKRVLMWDVKGEEAELNRALQINPNSSQAHLFMGLLQACLGNSTDGSRHIDQAVRLDPLSPFIRSWQVYDFVTHGRLDEALVSAKRTMEIDPNYAYFEPALALVYRQQGRLADALDIYLRVAQTSGQPSSGLAITYARLGKKDDARRVLEKLLELAKKKYYAGDQIASVYIALGEKDAAFEWLNRAINEHSSAIHRVAFDPDFKDLRSDPRFPALLARIGLDIPASPRRN
jgi:TolB-like protein/Tfp pilus assembly protein PilF